MEDWSNTEAAYIMSAHTDKLAALDSEASVLAQVKVFTPDVDQTSGMLLVDNDEDDDCVICYQTLYRPAKTLCQHMACESCMLHWALTAMENTNGAGNLPTTVGLAVDGIKFKCPTCRTYTEAKFDDDLDRLLSTKYPQEYNHRAAEEASAPAAANEDGTENMFLIYGNSHRTLETPVISPYTGKMCKHEWTFFVQSSRPEVLELVHIILHPTFREDRLVTLDKAPFSITRKGWGAFTVFAGLQLKEGYQWADQERVIDSDARNGRVKDKLPVEWALDFGGNGSQQTKMFKIRKVLPTEKDKAEAEEDLTMLELLLSEAELRDLREVKRLKALASES